MSNVAAPAATVTDVEQNKVDEMIAKCMRILARKEPASNEDCVALAASLIQKGEPLLAFDLTELALKDWTDAKEKWEKEKADDEPSLTLQTLPPPWAKEKDKLCRFLEKQALALSRCG